MTLLNDFNKGKAHMTRTVGGGNCLFSAPRITSASPLSEAKWRLSAEEQGSRNRRDAIAYCGTETQKDL